MFGLFKDKETGTASFEEQLKVLAKGGILLHPRVVPEALLYSFSRAEYEKDPYRLLLCVMGQEAEEQSQVGDSGFPSDRIWHFDTECIEDHGAYIAIAERLSLMAQGTFPLQQIEDYVDLDEPKAWLSFSLDGQVYKWDAVVNEDWVDPGILSKMAHLLESRKAGRRFTYVDLEGQDCLLGCSTPQEQEWLEAKTGLTFQWLN